VKLTVLAVVHRMPAWVTAGYAEYAKRMPREISFKIKELKPSPRGEKQPAVARWQEWEAERIAAAMPAGALRVLLDEHGQQLSSQALAQQFGRWRDSGRDVVFVIGGADGLAPRLKAEADMLWSLSALTMPHGLVRVVLAEQLYRASSILSGHPYHRE